MMMLPKIFSFIYRSAEFLAMNIGASHKVTMTLDYRRRWQSFLPETQPKSPGLWIHGASVGELEDLAAFYTHKELLIQSGYDYSQLIITSSSPSAEEFLEKIKIKFNPRYAGPLPPDVTPRVEEFFQFLNPELLILSQSDLWPVLMSHAKIKLKRGAIWLPHKEKSASWGKNIFLKNLVKKIALRRTDSLNPINSIASEFIGSPRIDRILDRIEKSKSQAHPLEKEIAQCPDKLKILIGSGWKEDALILYEAIQQLKESDRKNIEVFIIPHEVKDPTEATSISALFPKKVIARQGILLEAYRNFDVAFVGGGFRTGLHNVIEALAWGIPVICGDDLSKQPEAPYFQRQGSLTCIKNSTTLSEFLTKYLNNIEFKNSLIHKATEARDFLKSQSGASQRLSKLIKDL